jgi:galactokinase
MDSYTKQSFSDEKDLKSRLRKAKKIFFKLYKTKEEIIVRSPGRAEIIGNHTDYNHGFTLSNCISKSVLVLLKKRKDNVVRIYSTNFPTNKPLEFIFDKIKRDEINRWANYPKGVILELEKRGIKLCGCDILVDSNVPTSGGVSSSAALELAVALGFLKLAKKKLKSMELALLCQNAENQFVQSPCGFLDQGTIAFGKSKKMVYMDYEPKANEPVSEVKSISANIDKMGASFVVAVDKNAKRELGLSGYPARRKMCEESLPFWAKALKRKIGSLRDVSVLEFEKHKDELDKLNSVMRKRVEHIVYENFRVLESIKALRKKDLKKFGTLLTESGNSALSLYELDEKTPELTHLYNFGQTLQGVLGIRNMGGGFSATILALVRKSRVKDFTKEMALSYKNKFGGNLEFIDFKVTNGAGVLQA